MKSLKIIFLALSAITFFSCKKESRKITTKICGQIVRIRECYLFKDQHGYFYTIQTENGVIDIASPDKYSIKTYACFDE